MLAPIHESVRIELPDSGMLAGDLSYAQTTGDFAVVWLHGFGSHHGGEKAAALEAACSRRGWTFAAFDFQGHGSSSGAIKNLRASALMSDLDAIRRYLATRGIVRLGLVGSSMGAFAAAWYAIRVDRETVPACVFLAPAFRFLEAQWDKMTAEKREAWHRTGTLTIQNEWITAELEYGLVEEREQFSSVELAARWDRPALIFHGACDEVVPLRSSLAFIETTKETRVELRVFRDGDHRLTAYKVEIAEESCRFLTRYLT